MSQQSFTESVVEDTALAWLETLGYGVKHGPEIAFGELAADRVESGTLVGSHDRLLPKLLSDEVRVNDLKRYQESPFDG